MALESVFAIAPPLVGEKNKDTKNDDMESMENEGSDDGLEDEDLEEGEILDSGGEGESEEKTGNAQQTNGISGVQQSALGGPVKRKNADIGDQDGSDGTELHQKKKALYIDHDEVLDEDDWGRGVTFNVKRSQYQDSLEDFKRKMAAYKRKESQFSNSDGSANEDSLPGDRRSASPSSVKAKRKSKLVSMCRLKGKKSGAKGAKKRKLDSKSKSLRQKRELRHNRPTCKFFLDGKCAKGSDCPFYHPPPHPRKKELCKFYSSGHCAKGKHCYFMHEEFPCKFYHTGAICYSKESCRFSHKPLTEETRRLLDKHLGSFNRGDDDDDDDVDEDYYRERSRRPGKPESKAKRPCLLGSPPRHIREAAETKQWQEEMKKLQHESKVPAFEIQVGPTKEVPPPSKFSRPNYYSDTLPCSSPRRRTPSGEVSDSVSSSKSYEVLNQPKFASLIAEESDKDWTSICDMVNKLSPSLNDNAEKVGSADQEYFEMNPEEKNHPEVSEDMEPLVEPEKAPSPTRGHQEIHNSEFVESPKQDNERAESPEERTPVHVSESYPLPEVTLPPINIPSHLPRKQRELFMRIQHNQKRIPSEESAATNATPDTPEKMEVVKAEGEINEPIIKKDDDFYSSEEDDDIDQPLTNVLKKLHETPCPKDKDASPATTTPPPIDIVQMIKSITEKASEKPQSSAYHETEAFWQNILSSSAPLSAPSVVTTVASQSPSTIETPQSPKDSENAEISRDPRKGAQEPKPSIPRDPRLQNREQRKPSRDFPSFPSPPLSIEDSTNTFTPLVDPKIGSQLPNKLRDISAMLQNPTPAVVVEGLQGLGSFPYKLHEVSASPPNYLSYIYASNYDTKLLSDPRLRKHIAQGSNTVQQLALQSRGITLPNIPLLPLNSLNSDIGSPVQNEDNLGEKNSSASEGLKSEEVKIPLQKVVDPRVRKTDATVDPRRAVHTPVSETVPTRSHPVVPSPASHLPRAIADPRLAKLHHPLDPRRPRSIAERNSQRMSERKVAAALPPKNVPSASAEEKNSLAKSATENVAPCESVSKVELEDKNKRDVQENGSKKLGASKNRKSSMSYASPLNSCEDSVSSSAPGYNSYNQRPKRRMPNVPPVAESCVPVNDSASKSPDFSVCDSSLLGNEDPENSTSLKDMFKTIDPAASPFC